MAASTPAEPPLVAGAGLAIALEAHRANDLARARRIYRALLADSPAHLDALHLLGVVETQLDAGSCQGLWWLRAAQRAAGPSALVESSLSTATAAVLHIVHSLRRAGADDRASELAARVVALFPDSADGHHALGVVLRHARQLRVAATHMRAACALDPRGPLYALYQRP